MPRGRREDEYIPIKIEGWNGKFVRNSEKSAAKPSRNLQQSDVRNFYGQSTEPETLPPEWDGTFVYQGNGMPIYRVAGEQRNQSNPNQFFGFSSEPEILPTQWSGEFKPSSEVRIIPERNFSDSSRLHVMSSEQEMLPTQWDGRFELDPNDIRICQERNFSDARNYAEAKRFTQH